MFGTTINLNMFIRSEAAASTSDMTVWVLLVLLFPAALSTFYREIVRSVDEGSSKRFLRDASVIFLWLAFKTPLDRSKMDVKQREIS